MTKKKAKWETASLLFLYHLITDEKCRSIDLALFSYSLTTALKKAKSSNRLQVVMDKKNPQQAFVIFPEGDIRLYHAVGDTFRLCASDWK